MRPNLAEAGRRGARDAVRAAGRHLYVKPDPTSGFFLETYRSRAVYIRSRRHHQPAKDYDYLCREVYFREYCPQGDDTVVDVGAGYGHESLYVNERAPGVRYVGVEVQPAVYECLANTYAPYRNSLVACPYAITSNTRFAISSRLDYDEVTGAPDAPVQVPTLTWGQFMKCYGIDRVSLLKINIEGGERALLEEADLSVVDRVIVSTHDFRADLGHGEEFRTSSAVLARLGDAGFRCRPIEGTWYSGWFFADRVAARK